MDAEFGEGDGLQACFMYSYSHYLFMLQFKFDAAKM